MIEPNSIEATARAVTLNADDLAEQLFAALSADVSHASPKPFIQSSGDQRDVLLDGHFDLVVVARLLRETLRKDVEDLLRHINSSPR